MKTTSIHTKIKHGLMICFVMTLPSLAMAEKNQADSLENTIEYQLVKKLETSGFTLEEAIIAADAILSYRQEKQDFLPEKKSSKQPS